MLAPGNRVRSEEASKVSEAGVSMIRVFLHRIGRETFYTALYLTVPFGIAVALYLFACRKKCGVRSLIRDICSGGPLLFVALALVSIYVMTFASGFADRIFQFPMLMLAVSVGISTYNLNSRIVDHEQSNYIHIVFSIVVVLLLIVILTEVTAGSLYAFQSGTFFDRKLLLYHIDDPAVDGLMPGNGVGHRVGG